MVDVSGIAKRSAAALVPLLTGGLRALASSLLVGLGLTGIAMLLAAYFGSRHGELWPRLVAAGLVGAIGATATVMIASKRAVFEVVGVALTQLALGTTLFRLVFNHILRIDDQTERGERLGVVGGTLETRIPLAQAEQRLQNAVASIISDGHGISGIRGWLLGRVRRVLLRLVAKLTLARFRAEGQAQGAVDLIKVRDELGQGVDSLLIDQVHGIGTRTTWLLGAAAATISSLVTCIIYWVTA